MSRRAFHRAFLSTAAVVAVAAGVIRATPLQPGPPRTLDATRPIAYFIADGAEENGYRRSDRQLAQWAFDAWRRSSGDRLQFEPSAEEASAVVRLYWSEANGGQYGEMRPLLVGGRRGAAVYIRPDIDALGETIALRARIDPLLRDTIVYLTCVHELGHALGLTHTRDFEDIMYFFGYGGDLVEFFERYRRQLHTRSDIASLAGVSDSDIRRLKTMYP